MELFIHTEDHQVIILPFSQDDTLQMIEEKLRRPTPIEFCCNNTILAKTISLSNYQITNGTHIYAVSTNKVHSHQHLINQFKLLKHLSNKRITSLKMESEKLKDVLFMKVEGTCKYYRKVVKRYNNISKPKEEIEQTDEFIEPTKEITEPSAVPLPAFWKEDDF